MAFQLVQKFNFDGLDCSYDRKGDVLDVSFGPPAPAIALQVEDWLAIRIRLEAPFLQGMTIVGFKRILKKVNQYQEELPHRMKRLAHATVEISYDDSTDALIMRVGAVPSSRSQEAAKKLSSPSIFEPLSVDVSVTGSARGGEPSLRNVYVEKSLPSKEFVGIKILEYTRCGPAAFEAIFGAIIDTLFEPATQDENAHLMTNALIQHFDWQALAPPAA